MHTQSSRSRFLSAFTLVELLVVIAIIGVLVGSIGVALRGNDRGVALAAAQSSLSGLVAAARAQAAVSLSPAYVVVWGEFDENDVSTSKTFLRRAAVMTHEDTDGNGSRDAYVRRGDVIDLPRGVYFVPPDLGGSYPAKYENSSDWPDAKDTDTGYYRTQASAATGPENLAVQRFDVESGDYEDDPAIPTPMPGYRTIAFDSLGQVVGVNRALVIALGEPDDDGVVFKDSDSQRGLFLSEYGYPTIINEKAGLRKSSN